MRRRLVSDSRRLPGPCTRSDVALSISSESRRRFSGGRLVRYPHHVCLTGFDSGGRNCDGVEELRFTQVNNGLCAEGHIFEGWRWDRPVPGCDQGATGAGARRAAALSPPAVRNSAGERAATWMSEGKGRTQHFQSGSRCGMQSA